MESARSFRSFLLLSAAFIFMPFPLLLSGCGGGGGGAAPRVQSTVPLVGTVEDSIGAPQAGDTVVFDSQNQYKGTTNSSGQFSIAVPLNLLTANDTFTVFDSNGLVLGQLAVNTTSLSGSPRNVGVIVIGPPPPPAK